MTKLITIKQILALGLCEEYDTTAKIIAETDSNWPKTMLEISELDISVEDRFWVLNKLLDPTTAGHVMCDIAESVLHLYEARYPGDYRARDCISTRRMWLDGSVDEEALSVASDAAYAAYVAAHAAAHGAVHIAASDAARATYAAACGVAYGVAYAAAHTAARAAVYGAAAYNATYDATYDAALTTTWDKNLEILKKYL